MIYHWHTKLLSIRLELFIPPKLVLKMSSFFSDKLMITIIVSQSLSSSSMMDVFCMAGVHQQPEPSNYLAEDQT